MYPKRGTRGFSREGFHRWGRGRSRKEINQYLQGGGYESVRAGTQSTAIPPTQRSESWKVEEIRKWPLRFSCRAQHFQDSQETRTLEKVKGNHSVPCDHCLPFPRQRQA